MSAYLVGAGLTVTGFRDNLDELYAEFRKNALNRYSDDLEEKGIDVNDVDDATIKHGINHFLNTEPFTDIMMLMTNSSKQWTAPRHDLHNGALFFYLSSQAFTNARKLYNQAQKDTRFYENPKLMEALRASFDFISQNHRHVIGVGRVTGIAEYGSGVGFSSRYFASCDIYTPLEHPISYDILKNYVIVNARSVYTIPGKSAQGLLETINATNKLPRVIKSMKFGETRYGHLNKKNWLKLIGTTHIDISSDYTTSPEGTLRYHFFDYLIDFIKDNGTNFYTESTTYRDNTKAGRADYMVSIHGHWIPFEAKVNINTERNLPQQIEKYTYIDSFVTEEEGVINSTRHGICLLGDQYGIYLTENSRFINCSPGNPLWPRTSINADTPRLIRDYVAQYL